MRTLRYLAYGSNLLPARLAARIEVISTLGVTILPHWSLRYHKRGADGSGKCNLVAHSGSSAYGVVYEISHADKARLDEIEGVGNGYQNTTLILPDHGEVWVYLAEASHIDETLVPYDWYKRFVAQGANHHKLPAHYIAEIESVKCIDDPDLKRRDDNLSIIKS